MKDYFLSLFISLCIVQFFFPILALMIKKRFKKLGYNMKESPYSSIFNISGFWGEAREKNSRLNDDKIDSYLSYRNLWWLLALISFTALVFL